MKFINLYRNILFNITYMPASKKRIRTFKTFNTCAKQDMTNKTLNVCNLHACTLLDPKLDKTL